MTIRAKSIIIFVIVLTIVLSAGYRIWNKPFKNPLEGNAIKVTAIQLYNEFSSNEAEAHKKYVSQNSGDKKVEVTGKIAEMMKNEDGEISYNLQTNDEIFGVKCIMDKGEEVTNAKVGDIITVRGFCNGYNMDVIINRCKAVKN